jgi:N-acetylneuraminic acid mutarotase
LAIHFAIGSKGYVGLGYNSTGVASGYYSDLWEYDPATNKWTQKADFTGAKATPKFSFANTSRAYVVSTQEIAPSNRGDVWEFYSRKQQLAESTVLPLRE